MVFCLLAIDHDNAKEGYNTRKPLAIEATCVWAALFEESIAKMVQYMYHDW